MGIMGNFSQIIHKMFENHDFLVPLFTNPGSQDSLEPDFSFLKTIDGDLKRVKIRSLRRRRRRFLL